MASQIRPKVHVTKISAWSNTDKNWAAEDFAGVIWSNECSVEGSKDSRG